MYREVSSSSMWAGHVGSMDEDHIPRQTKGSGEKAEYKERRRLRWLEILQVGRCAI